MDNAATVRFLEPLYGLDREVQHSADAERTILDFLRQFAALQIGHGDKELSVCLVDFIDGADVGVL